MSIEGQGLDYKSLRLVSGRSADWNEIAKVLGVLILYFKKKAEKTVKTNHFVLKESVKINFCQHYSMFYFKFYQ